MADGPGGTTDPAEPADPDGTTDPAASDRKPAWREFPFLLLTAVVLAIVIKSLLIQAFFIPSGSMVPTLQRGDRILVCRVCMHVSDIHRGEILVFSDPNPDPGTEQSLIGGFFHWLGEGIGVAQSADEDFIKRVGALPGQTWEIRKGQLYVDGEPVDEPYLNEPADRRSFGPQTVPDGMLLMLGDNRLHSGDSRFTPDEGGLGYVPEDTVIGRAFVIIWPFGRAGWMR